jgi:2-(3-amino-3-carboxypropyl)histidine synthase
MEELKYDFEIEKAVEKIKKEEAKLVCIQMPEGLKPKAVDIAKELEEKTEAKILIWADTCYGGCDVPLELKFLNIDLLIQFGHNSWGYDW